MNVEVKRRLALGVTLIIAFVWSCTKDVATPQDQDPELSEIDIPTKEVVEDVAVIQALKKI